MKTIAYILVLLFAVPAFADSVPVISIYESEGVVYTIDITPPEYVPPEPVDTETKKFTLPDSLKPDLIDVLNFLFVNSLD